MTCYFADKFVTDTQEGPILEILNNNGQQAGAELCQAQQSLSLDLDTN